MRRFELEHYLSANERSARFVLGTSGVATLPPEDFPEGRRVLDLDYGHVPGEPALQAAVAAARGVPESSVLLTMGGTEALFLAPFALVEPGQRVLVESPAYFPLVEVPRVLGARVERFERTLEGGWHVDVDALIERLDRDVALVALADPNNPTGRLVPPRDLVRLARACEEVGAYLLVDDIFRSLVAPRPPCSHSLHPRIVTAESLTKCHGLSGLRAGWLLAAPDVRGRLRDAKALTSVVNPAITQHLAVEALRQEEALLARAMRIARQNLAAFRASSSSRGFFTWREPDSPLITALRLPVGVDDVKWCEALLRAEGVLLVPGSFLDLPGHVRMGFGQDPASFAAGLAALERFVARGG